MTKYHKPELTNLTACGYSQFDGMHGITVVIYPRFWEHENGIHHGKYTAREALEAFKKTFYYTDPEGIRNSLHQFVTIEVNEPTVTLTPSTIVVEQTKSVHD